MVVTISEGKTLSERPSVYMGRIKEASVKKEVKYVGYDDVTIAKFHFVCVCFARRVLKRKEKVARFWKFCQLPENMTCWPLGKGTAM